MKPLIAFLLVLLISTPLSVRAETVTTDELVLQLAALSQYLERTLNDPKPLSDADLKNLIVGGTDWIINAQEENGHFAYEYLPYEDRYRADDNTVRQAGTLFVLAEVYRQQTAKDPKLATAIERGISFLTSLTTKEDEIASGQACVKTSVRSSKCQLGSTSLTLLAILSYVSAEPVKVAKYENQIASYLAFIDAARFPGAGFSSSYVIEDGFVSSESPYFNGETLLALVRAYQYKPSEALKTMIKEVFGYLSTEVEQDTGLYLWMMASVKDMNQLWPDTKYVTYTKAYTDTLAPRVFHYRHRSTHNNCALTEGLTSALSVFGPTLSAVELAIYENEQAFWLSHSAEFQINQADTYRLINNDGMIELKRAPNLTQALGGFLTGSEELTQRIDFTQHCVSAYLQQYKDRLGLEL